jgi:ankyrin repeat protein
MDQFEASRKGDLQELRNTLSVNNVNDVVNGGSFTTLHFAAQNGHADCARYCIEMGANVNACVSGVTPLHFASLNGNGDVVRLLLDAGAAVDSSVYGWTPLHRAIRYNHAIVAQMLIDRGAKISNVQLDSFVQDIPDWVNKLIESRSNCLSASIVIIGIHKYRRTITGTNDVNVLKLISKHVWSTRMDNIWIDANKL